MKLFRYLVLLLLVCNIPSIMLISYGTSTGSLFSYLTFALLLLYYFLNKKHKPLLLFIVFTLTYYIISGLVYVEDEEYYLINFAKYLVIIICGAELAINTNNKELVLMLLIGASSILANAVFWPFDYGRYSGFFIDPNSAGFLCLLGCALSYTLTNEKWKIISLFYFTFCGVLTFSRTFLVLWVLMMLIAVFQNKKNTKILLSGIGALILFFGIQSMLTLNEVRLSLFDSLFNYGSIGQVFAEGARPETWALYFEHIFDHPFLGSGFQSFMSNNIYEVGVHNNFLRVIGEAGIIPFVLFTGIYLYILIESYKSFSTKPHLFLLAIILIATNMANHNFDNIYHITFVTLWVYIELMKIKSTPKEIDVSKN